MNDNELGIILDRTEALLADDLLPADIFNNQAVFDAEIERIFGRSWLFVAHESEIPNKGDFVVRKLGRDNVIVARDDNGKINVMSNNCRHRGAEVCQVDHGNTKYFTCPYHGWAYKNNGDWFSAQHFKAAYGGKLDAKRWGLVHVAQVDTYQGLIFATIDPDAKPLKEYLGGGAWMLDVIFGACPEGMKVIGKPERYRVKADWKTAAENFSGDVYHVGYLHYSNQKVDVVTGLEGIMEFGRSYELGDGHNFVGHEWIKAIGPDFTYGGTPQAHVERYDLSGFDETQRTVIRDKPPTVGTIFPNLSLIRVFGWSKMDEPFVVFTSLRQWQPVGPGEIEIWSWQLVWKFVPDEEAAEIYRVGQFNFGSAGLFEQDDTVSWEGIPRAAASQVWKKAGAEFHFQQGRNSKVDQTPDPDWQGPGVYRHTGIGEHRQLAFHREWLKRMREGGAQ